VVYDRQRWREKAACRNLTPQQVDELFFVTQGKSANPARNFCSHCPVQAQCRDFALFYKENGIWGGTTDGERETLTKSLLGLLTTARFETIGVNTSETREQTQWGLGTQQILESRLPSPAPVVSEPPPLNPQPPMLLIEL
jgi:hypothetical protein